MGARTEIDHESISPSGNIPGGRTELRELCACPDISRILKFSVLSDEHEKTYKKARISDSSKS
jgi:hypothetical protein